MLVLSFVEPLDSFCFLPPAPPRDLIVQPCRHFSTSRKGLIFWYLGSTLISSVCSKPASGKACFCLQARLRAHPGGLCSLCPADIPGSPYVESRCLSPMNETSRNLHLHKSCIREMRSNPVSSLIFLKAGAEHAGATGDWCFFLLTQSIMPCK